MVDRIRRALAEVSDRVSSVVEPISTGLGKAFGVADWAVELFAEEVVRGGPAFALSLVGFQCEDMARRHSAALEIAEATSATAACTQVLGPLEKGLRSAAELGAWQLISPVDARGRVLLVDGLHEIQDEVCTKRLI